MILDSIIGLFAELGALLVALLAEGVPLVLFAGANFGLMLIELVGGLFVAGFRVRRLERPRLEVPRADAPARGLIGLGVMVALIGCWLLWTVVMERKITLVAVDGHSLPFAALIVHTTGGDERQRTDSAGNVVIPRFFTSAVTIKDPRYVEKTWTGEEIESELVVGRTILGSGLDVLADRLLKPAGEGRVLPESGSP